MGGARSRRACVRRTSARRSLAPPNTFQNALKALKPPTAEMATLDLVHHQQKFLFAAELAKAEQVFGRRGSYSAFTLNAFDQNCGGCGGNGFAHRIEVVVGHIAETRHGGVGTPF